MKTKNIIITAVVIILVLIGIAIWRSQTNNAPVTPNSATGTPTDTATPTAPATNTASGTPTGTTPAAKLSYDDALALYAGRLFQFKDCVAGPPPVISPGSLSIKKSTKYMIDNRHTEAHTIRVGTQSYRLGANSFVIATAPSSRGTYNITCDGGGVAQLLVQP